LLHMSPRTTRGAVFNGVQRLMAKKAKPMKKGKKLRAAKKLEKKTTLRQLGVVKPRLPY
jgi:hypothetical protein